MVIDSSDDLSLLRDDLRLAILSLAEAVQLFVLDAGFACFHGAAFAPCDIGGDGLALRLCEGTGEGDAKLTVLLQRVDVLLLEDDGDAQGFEGAGVVEAVHRVSCEAGYRLGQYHVYLVLTAMLDHSHEVLTLFCRGAGDTFIRKDAAHRPFRVGHDLIGVVFSLHLIAVGLILLFGGHAAVRRHTKLPAGSRGFCRFWLGRNLNDSWGCFSHCRSLLSMT